MTLYNVAELRATLRRTIQGNIERPHYAAGPGAYWELAAKVGALLDALDDVPVIDQPRRLLCHYCVSDASEGQTIFEAMTIVNGTATCHEHIDEHTLERAERGGPKC